MSFYVPARLLPQRFRLILASFLQQPGLPFTQALTEESIHRAFEDEGLRFAQDPEDVYTPAVTLWAFLSQVLFKEEHRSCVAAVARVMVLLVALERGPCSGNTGAYCRARAKLPEAVLRRLVTQVADGCEGQVPEKWLWHGRHVYLIDGTTVSMPDTPANQAAYPQLAQLAPGLGFPIARVLVMLSLATGMLKDMDLSPFAGAQTSDTAMLRRLLSRFEPQDILLADRYFCTYFMIALLVEAGLDFVTRVHQTRPIDFRRGQRLGHGDQIIQWLRPHRPEWMDPQTYARMPRSLQVRQVYVHVNHPGFRVRSLVAVTTLLDARVYTCEDIAALYGQRWLVELDIRAIKLTLGMDILRCKTPAMVRKEMWTCLLAYNLIRRTLLQSAHQAGRRPCAMSFAAGLQAVAASWQALIFAADPAATRLIETALSNLAAYTVGNRPGRIEPRRAKRRPRWHEYLTQPRDQARAKLMRTHGT